MNNRIAHIHCGCKHEFQDDRYNKKRVANLMDKSVKSGVNEVEVKCTVCSKIHRVNKNQLK